MIYLFIGAGSSAKFISRTPAFLVNRHYQISTQIMKNILIAILFTALIGLLPHKVLAFEAGASAQLETTLTIDESAQSDQLKISAIKNVLTRYNSPLAGEAEAFVITARALHLDPYLLPSISGVESGFGLHYIKNTHNVFGFGVGKIPFDNFADGIARVGYALRYKYINRGTENLAQIGHRYAGGSTTWAPKVQHFMNAFEREEQKLSRFDYLSS